MSSATRLLEAVETFLETSAAVSFNRRKRRALKPIERRLELAMQRAFRRQGRVFVKKLATLKDRFPTETSEARLSEAIEEWEWLALYAAAVQETLKAFTEPIDLAARRALRAGALHVLADAGVALSFTLKNPRAVSFLKEYGAQRVTKINETTRDYIKSVVTQGVEEGWSYDKMARAITARYEEFAVGQPQQHIASRAHLVAVTEAGEAYCEGNMEVAQDLEAAGLTMMKKWSTVGDSKVSDGCRDNEAVGWIPLNQAFPSGHQRPLRFPGCRCDLLTKRADAMSKAA
ncbi:phage minor head protein [Halomonas sp.]|uniref:phage minor head protein n=1 Tax=Halomonas sp. TaxID=1486246 RepID=UPI003D0A7C59